MAGLPSVETLSLEAQVAQLVVVRASGHLFDHQRRYPQWELSQAELEHCVATLGVGGVILLGGSAVEVGVRSQQLQSWATVPLLLAADVEEGVGQRFAGATQWPPPMALAAIAQQDSALACTYAEQMGAFTAQEAIAIGLNWLLAPVVDVNNNVDNPVINVRAFGETPERVSQLSQAFIRGAQRFPVLTTAKHFPGHGDTAVDSHLHLPEIAHDRPRLEQVELAPFRAAIASGVDAVMTAHLKVPALDAHWPATLSPPILTQLLRQDLGFGGLVVTDALIMGAIAQHYGPAEAAVLALAAGADVLLMPADPAATIAAVCAAVRQGQLTPDRIATSVARLWRAKQKVNSALSLASPTGHAWEQVPPPPVQLAAIATPTARQTLTQILTASQQTRGHLAVLPPTVAGLSIVIVDDVLTADWLRGDAPAIALPPQYGYQTHLADAKTCATRLEDWVTPPRSTVLQIFSRGNPFKGTANLNASTLACFQQLQLQGCLAGLVVYGSPYVLGQLLPQLAPTVPYGFTYGHTPEAQATLLAALWPPAQRRGGGLSDFTD